MSSRASQEISGLLEWSFILLESRRWECSQSQKSIIYAIVKKLGPTIINMENIHLKPQISVLGISSPAGWLADLTWKYLDQSVMIDVDQRQWETMTRLMRRADWPVPGHSQMTPARQPRLLAADCRPSVGAAEEKICKIFSSQTIGLPACWLWTFSKTPAGLNASNHCSGVTGCCIVGSEGLVRTSGSYNALIGFSIEQGAGHQPSKTLR